MSKIAFHIGIIEIHWYSIMIVLGILTAIFLIYKEAKRHDINKEFLTNLIFYVLLFGIIGARIYYVIFNFDEYAYDLLEIFKVWHGGLAIHGGIIAGALTLIIYCKKWKVSALKMFDISSVGLIIAQAIGRWGNFFNQEAHGGVVTRAFLEKYYLPKFIIEGMNIEGVYYHPTFLYESLWNILGFIIMLFLRRRRYNKTGEVFGFYLIWYSIGRIFIEQLRTDSLMLGTMKVAQLVSGVMILVGIIIIIISKRGDVFENKYNVKEKEKVKFK